jgi:hypothetical protein
MLFSRRLRLPPVNCHTSLRFTALRPGGLGFRWLDWHWQQEQAVWINRPWALIPDILGKITCERPAAVMIVPKWQTQTWWLSLLALGGTHIDLPLPKFCVHALHSKLVEPFLHQAGPPARGSHVQAWDSTLAHAALGPDSPKEMP